MKSITIEGAATAYLAIVNLWAFFLVGLDKRRARRHRDRVPERRFHLLALLGGFVGGWIGIALFRHKTRKVSFLLPFALMTVISIALLVWGWTLTVESRS